MTNGAAGAPLVFEIMRSIAAEYGWDGWLAAPVVPIKVEGLAAFAGRYRRVHASDGSLVIEVNGDRLVARRALRAPLELVPIAHHTFVSRSDGARFTFGAGEVVETLEGEKVVHVAIARDTIEPSALLAGGRFDDALTAYRALDPLDEQRTEHALDVLGRDLLDKRFDERAGLLVFRIEAALYPDSAGANAALAFAYLRNGDLAAGQPFFDRAEMLRAQETPRDDMVKVYRDWRLARFRAAIASSRDAKGRSAQSWQVRSGAHGAEDRAAMEARRAFGEPVTRAL